MPTMATSHSKPRRSIPGIARRPRPSPARPTDNKGVTYTSRASDVFVSLGGGLLVASADFPPAQDDLGEEGVVDWTHWGLARAKSFDHRSGATTRISDATTIGNGQPSQ